MKGIRLNKNNYKLKIFSIFLLFGLSGFSGLIYESVWTHYIKLILGHAAYAQTLVLVTFMGGLAIGAWLVSRNSSRFQRPLMWYVAIELVIGLFGILFHYEFQAAHNFLFDVALPAIGSPFLAGAIKWLVALLVLLPQSLLLGMTFPLIGAAIIRLQQLKPGEILSVLYFSNSLGAVVGILTSGFLLIEWVGLPGTSLTAGVVNVIVALSVWMVAGGYESAISHPAVPADNTEFNTDANKPDTSRNLLLVVALLTGLSSFFYEIGWIRMLSLVLSSSVHAFELMLSAFILGLALGGLYIRKKADSLKEPLITLGWIQIAMGFLAIATLPVYAGSFDVMAYLINALDDTDSGYTVFNITSHMIAMAIMVPATFMAGMTLPLITTILFRSGSGEKSIGRVYSANTFGAIAGIVIAINILMPLVGATNLIVFGGIIDIAVGVYLIHRIIGVRIKLRRYLVPLSAIIGGAIIFSLTPFDKAMLSSGVYRFGNTDLMDNANIPFYKDGRTASISFIEYPDGEQSIGTNGKTDALLASINKPASADEITMVMLGAIPLLYRPEIEYVANIGLGSGLTTHTLLASSRIKRLDTIEIESQVVKGAQHFGKRVERTFLDKRSKIHIDDAKSYFSSRNLEYDAVISEPSNPWISGVSSLFTQEYYSQIKRYLKKDGIFVQWLQLYELNIDSVVSVLKALDAEFGNYVVYNTSDGDLIIIASETNSLDKTYGDIFSNNSLSRDLKRVGLESAADFDIRYLGNRNILSYLIETYSVPVNSDYFPYLSYSAPRSRYKHEYVTEFIRMKNDDIPVINWLSKRNISQNLSENGSFYSYYVTAKTARNVMLGNIDQLSNDYLRSAALQLRSNRFRCEADTFKQFGEIEALIAVGSAINSYPNKHATNRFWNGIREKCSRASSNSKAIIVLLLEQAIASHDSKKILALTGKLLYQSKDFPQRILDHILKARLLAAIDLGDQEAGYRTIIENDLASRIDKVNLSFRLLISMTLSRQQAADQPHPDR